MTGLAAHIAFFQREDAGDPAEQALPWASSCWMEGDSLAPPCSSDMRVIDAMMKLAGVNENDYLADLGAGDGRVCIHAALNYQVL